MAARERANAPVCDDGLSALIAYRLGITADKFQKLS